MRSSRVGSMNLSNKAMGSLVIARDGETWPFAKDLYEGRIAVIVAVVE